MSYLIDYFSNVSLHLGGTRVSAMWFLPFALPIAAWTAWNDLRTMRIPNRTVLLLAGLFIVIGPLALPFPEYLWRLGQMAVVLVIGFFLNQFGGIGAGDVKFAAAAAGMFAPVDSQFVMLIFASILLAAFATHRLFRAIGPVRAAVPEWKSWGRRDFPMGFALGATLAFYLLLVLRYGV
jgi:prepilin peptidase CpaA